MVPPDVHHHAQPLWAPESICFIAHFLMPSCDLLQVTDSTTGAPVGEEELCHEGKHFHSMSRQATKIALETSLPVLSSRSWPTYDACIIEVLPK